MSEPVPQYVTWCGRAVHELSRDELHAAFSHLMMENSRLGDEVHARSVEHLRDLAARARR